MSLDVCVSCTGDGAVDLCDFQEVMPFRLEEMWRRTTQMLRQSQETLPQRVSERQQILCLFYLLWVFFYFFSFFIMAFVYVVYYLSVWPRSLLAFFLPLLHSLFLVSAFFPFLSFVCLPLIVYSLFHCFSSFISLLSSYVPFFLSFSNSSSPGLLISNSFTYSRL